MVRSPFPGMDPYLENPVFWPDFHDSLVAAIRDFIVPLVAPRYFVGLERRTYLLKPDDLVLVGLVGYPDIAVMTRAREKRSAGKTAVEAAVLEVDVPMSEEVGENFLEVHEVSSGRIVTMVEVLSPVNKVHPKGRRKYEEKRDHVFRSRTNLIEVDLLRAGEPMPVIGEPVRSAYRILVSRGRLRPRAQLYPFGLRGPIPRFPLPLLEGDPEPPIDLDGVLHELYARARFDLRLDYSKPPVPPLDEEDSAWARGLIESALQSED